MGCIKQVTKQNLHSKKMSCIPDVEPKAFQLHYLEEDRINERIKNENYRISILSGEPDKITEPLYSNLFEVKSFQRKFTLEHSNFLIGKKLWKNLQNM